MAIHEIDWGSQVEVKKDSAGNQAYLTLALVKDKTKN